jgi:apolipoprotein D and lipocalin family protein
VASRNYLHRHESVQQHIDSDVHPCFTLDRWHKRDGMNRLLAPLCVALLLCSCTTMKMKPLQTVPHLDLPRFMGDWYVIAHIPYSLEKGKVGTLDRYALRPDGKIQNSFLFRRGNLEAPLEEWKGVAWVVNKATNAEWRVQFLWPFRVPFLVTGLDEGYQWAVIGYPNRKLGWILSRDPQMRPADYEKALSGLREQGYDTSQFALVPQRKP